MLTRNLKLKILSVTSLLFSFFSGLYAQNGSGYFYQAENLFKAKKLLRGHRLYLKNIWLQKKKSRPRSYSLLPLRRKVKGKANLDPHQEASLSAGHELPENQ